MGIWAAVIQDLLLYHLALKGQFDSMADRLVTPHTRLPNALSWAMHMTKHKRDSDVDNLFNKQEGLAMYRQQYG